MRVFLGRRLSAKLVAVYERLTDAGPYRPDAAGAGRRALRNAALDLYAAGDHEGGSDIAMHQFQTADNMTNQFAALSVLSTLHAASASAPSTRSSAATPATRWCSINGSRCRRRSPNRRRSTACGD